MADRLISEEKLFNSRPEWLNDNMEDKEKSAYNKGWNACNNEWCDMIKEQLAAYDIDKVCRELRNKGAVDRNGMIHMSVAIDIVRKGGVE